MKNAVFMTGATGFLGTELAGQLIRSCDRTLYVLVRAGTEGAAYSRLRGSWDHDPALCGRLGTQVIPVCGDFTLSGLGLDPAAAQILRDEVSVVIHAGAETGFQKDDALLQQINCGGTENMLSFASGLPSLERFVHISTAYVAGRKKGVITEEEPAGTVFSSLYEKSKAEAESLVRSSGLPFSICRPGMIVGRTADGRVKNFNTIYYVLKLLLLGKLPVLPVDPKTRLNLIPVDETAFSIRRIAFDPEAAGKTFHLTCPTELQPCADELADYVRRWAAEHLGLQLPRPVYLPLPALRQAGLSYNRVTEGRRKGQLTNFLTLLPYFFNRQEFDRSNTDAIAGPCAVRWQDYIDRLLDYACRKNFMRQTGQTVFEQAMIRRASTRYPVTFYDVTPKGIRKYPGPVINERVWRTVRAMQAHGIGRGDRVALTGINSTHYMIIDQAVGLLGAVSVPIYYTTPAEEVSLLLSRSGAGWFFVGDARIMEQIGQIRASVTVVPFSRGLTAFSGHPSRPDQSMRSGQSISILPWKQFLRAGSKKAASEGRPSAETAGKTAAPRARQETAPDPALSSLLPPDPDDLATIRYTSGTTGEPKGVMFTYRQLAWMGEVLTGLLSWKERNRSMRYLSFLPLSHVVEGILAAYAPYYALCKVDYFFLNDFGDLTKALPQVRPNVFFSVPRFYEKVWEQFSKTRAGARWLAMKDGPAKQSGAVLLRRALLRRAGLDACGQLIVGSAPVQETLLRDFRALGIEIYNAYGQTEAPLITINRLGDNLLHTVGTPLPETEITVLPDGELLVRGPQVMTGYYGLETDALQDGVLHTGDLGILQADGHIVLRGRKKEFVVTAYGKNISIPKLEGLLRGLPGVSEAVLIGENRPFCTALLWLEEETGPEENPNEGHEASSKAGSFVIAEVPEVPQERDPGADAGSSRTRSALADEVARMNDGLSHPEQIRRYCVIDRPLSIRAGELTPNLKVKRSVVEDHLREQIEAMYRREPSMDSE